MSEIKSNLLSSNINLDGIELIDLFQIAHHLKLTSIIKVISSQSEIGYVLFEAGEITHCKIDNKLFAEDAFQEILTWSNYSVRNFKYDGKDKLERNINLRFEIFLLDTVRKMDEKAHKELPSDTTNKDNKPKEKELVSIYEIEKINEFCHDQHKKFNDVLAISVLDIQDKNIIGLSCKGDNEKELVQELSYYSFSIAVNKNIEQIESIINPNIEKTLFAEEFYMLGSIFQVSKSISDKFVLSLTWDSEINKMQALKTVRSVLLDLEKIL